MQWQRLIIGLTVFGVWVGAGCRTPESPPPVSKGFARWNEAEKKEALERSIPVGTPLADALATLTSNGFIIEPDKEHHARHLTAKKSDRIDMFDSAKWHVVVDISDDRVTNLSIKIEYIIF